MLDNSILQSALGNYSGLKFIVDNSLENVETVPARWRTFKERWFSLPFKPKQLFVYEDIPKPIMYRMNDGFGHAGMIICNSIAYNQIRDLEA